MKKLRILLDSTYLLPIIGIDVVGLEETLTILKELYDKGLAEYYYTPFNLIEVLGKIAKTRYDENRVRQGLTAIVERFNLVFPTIEGYLKALKLRTLGHRDFIDLLLYTTSLTRGLKFLTRDRDLIEFLNRVGEDIDVILYEERFIKEYKLTLS